MINKYKEPLPNFNSSYTHSCNNLASYEIKKNPNASKRNITRGEDLDRSETTTMV